MTMPSIYLSPSTQEYNPYITGAGSEEHFMNLIADAMEPYLTANTIRFGRNTPEMTAASSIRQGNAGNYDFYLALHSNGSTDGSREGAVRGIIAFYYPGSTNGQRAADIFVRNLKSIYPLPEKRKKKLGKRLAITSLRAYNTKVSEFIPERKGSYLCRTRN